ncbi:uncharacterized protein LOC130712458 [Lotus japonicus]|uniref:uncharacterized protein LOC130712458 n=1 Tax=Lotus japonicus TaxID=34305 RepID=UPI00258A169E|nr:uncharacterized protein LOC130712458 [Lotus japonicus]
MLGNGYMRTDGKYTVSSAYTVLLDSVVGEDPMLFNRLWSGVAPSNISAFVWRVVLDRIQSKANLRRRNIILDDAEARCSICNIEEESTNHLFFSCNLALQVWSYCNLWLGITTAMPRDARPHLLQHELPFLSSRQNDGLRAIWMTAVWSLWTARNNLIFREEQFDAGKIFGLIQVRSWKWLSTIGRGFQQSFSEWCSNPVLLCLKSIH